jgi:hypothetical protein
MKRGPPRKIKPRQPDRLGRRENETAFLEWSVSDCRAALQERTREREPLDWAAAQYNLGAALALLRLSPFHVAYVGNGHHCSGFISALLSHLSILC